MFFCHTLISEEVGHFDFLTYFLKDELEISGQEVIQPENNKELS